MSKKQILSAVIAASLITCSVPAVSYAQTADNTTAVFAWDGKNVKEPELLKGEYQISSPEELAWFAAEVNKGNNKISAVLTKDITLNENNAKNEWTPIGITEEGFMGNFDGLNHTISGLYINSGKYDNAGLFATLGKDGRVEYLNISDSQVTSSKNAGTIAGTSLGTIRDISVKNSVVSGGTSSVCGGIAGNTGADSKTVRCIFEGAVTNAKTAGGISGTVSGNAVIQDSYTDADISFLNKNDYAADEVIVGGIAGNINVSDGNPEISNCYSLGKIVLSELSAAKAGGIAGYITAGGTTENSASVKTSYSLSPITSDITLHVGNLFGEINDIILSNIAGKVINCYFNSDINSAILNSVGNILKDDEEKNGATLIFTSGLDSDAMKSEEFITSAKLGNSFVFIENENNGYPSIDALQYKEPSVRGISSAEEYKKYVELINNHEHFNADTFYSDMDFILIDSIDFENSELIPIGTEDYPFTGSFDFGRNPILNFKITSDNAALFGYIDGAELSGIVVDNAVFGSDTSASAAAIAYSCENSSIKNSLVADNVTFNAKQSIASITTTANNSSIESNVNKSAISNTETSGGIVANASNSTISKNINYAAVSSSTLAGGIAANSINSNLIGNTNLEAVTGSKTAGGITAVSANSLITENKNTGNIEGSEYVGGIAGFVSFNADEQTKADETMADKLTFIKNSNNGTVTNSSAADTDGYAGGIAAKVETDFPLDLSYNYSVCDIISNTTNTTVGGGLFGSVAAINDSNIRIRRSYFAGTITDENKKSGSLIGTASGNINLLRVFFDNTLCQKEIIAEKSDTVTLEDSVYGLSSEKMQFTTDFTVLLGVYYIYGKESDGSFSNNKYPIFNINADISEDDDDIVDDSLVLDETGTYYMIKNAAQLRKFSELSTKQGFDSANYKLMNDIDLGAKWDENGNLLSGEAWTPIGVDTAAKSTYPFKGNFDGNGHKINGLYINIDSDCGGLFGVLIGAEIKNVTVTSGYIKAVNNTGGIAGSVTDDTVIENCESNADVYGAKYVGGIVGLLQKSSTIISCTNKGNIIASSENAGGIVGTADESPLMSVNNNGDVISDGENAGGIAGKIYNSEISDAVNTGTITAKSSVGGIAGFVLNNTDLENTLSKGKISSQNNAGGIIGVLNSNKSDVSVSISNAVSQSDVSAETGNAGGIIGNITLFTGNISILDSDVNSNNISAFKGAAGGIIGYEMFTKSKYTTSIKNTSIRTSIKSNTDDCGAVIGNLLIDDDAPENYIITNSYFIGKGASVLVNDNDFEYTLDKCYMISEKDGKILAENKTGAELKCTAILADYADNGSLNDVDIIEINAAVPAEDDEAGAAEYETSLQNAELLVWDGLNTMVPMGFIDKTE